MDKIVIYPGRFQVFGPHHFAVYKKLCEKFGRECVFITTTDSTIGQNNILTFEEKVKFMEKFGIDTSKILQVEQPYRPNTIDFGNLANNKTSVIICLGQKDQNRLNTSNGQYYTPYMGQVHLYPMKTTGYVYTVPNIKLNHENSEINGTFLRGFLPLCNSAEFSKIMGWYDANLHELLRQKMGVAQSLTEGQITKTQLQRIEQYADKLFKAFGIDIEFQDVYKGTHFFQRLNDPRNQTQITSEELRDLFRKTSLKYGEKLSSANNGYEAVLKDMESDINMPFIIKFDRVNRELDLVPKTIMRKRDFKTPSPVLNLENYVAKNYTRHIYHPHEIPNCTVLDYFLNLKELFYNGFDASIKHDGLNLQMCQRNGQIMCSRNKSSVLNPMNREQLMHMFLDKPVVQRAFLNGFDLLRKFMFSSTFTTAHQKVKSQYPNSFIFLNCELLDPTCTNVFQYGNSQRAMVHGFVIYNNQGMEIGNVQFPQFNPLNFDGKTIERSPQVKIPPMPDAWEHGFNDLYKYCIEMLDQLNIASNSQLIEVKENFPEQFVEIIENFTYLIGNYIIQQTAPIKSQNDRDNILNIKQRYTDMLKNIQTMETEICNKFKMYNEKFIQSGGKFNVIEGLVFKMPNGTTCKLTGSFGPLNQILNLTRYKR